jgi:hypothetical protein
MDVIGGLTRKSSDRFAFLLFTFPSAFESKLSALLEMQKASQFDWLFLVERSIELSNLIWEGLGELEFIP